MKYFCILIVIVCLSTGNMMKTAIAGQIDISGAISSIINTEISKTKKILPLDEDLMDQNKKLVRTWVSGSIDMHKATKRISKRFDRTTYTQEVTAGKVRLLKERLKLTPRPKPQKKLYTPALQSGLIPIRQLEEPVQIIYREGPTYFKFKKFKEQKAHTSLKEKEIIKLVKDFLAENMLLIETDKDKISEIYVRERRINEDRGESKEPDDYLLQQSVIIEREYEGNPVINSKIEVGIFPDTKEIVLLKHFNWIPVEEKQAKQIVLQKQKPSSTSLRAEIQERLKQKIEKVSGNFTRAVVKKSFSAWFQTKDALIPVLAFDINIEHPSPKGPLKRSYLEVINLVGNDEVFFKGHGALRPSTAP